MEHNEEVVVKIEDEVGIFVKEEESFVGDTKTSTYDEDASMNLGSFVEIKNAQFDENTLIKPESFIEVTNTPAYDENASINFDDLLVENPNSSFVPIIGDMQRELLIYTKKVDDMCIWKKLYKFRDPKDILDQIIFESKPIWSGQFKKKKKRKYMIKFHKLEQKLQDYNNKVARYQQLYKEQTNIPTISIDDDDIPAEGDNGAIADNKRDIITLDNNIGFTVVDNQPQDESTRYILKIKILQSTLSEVYFINDKGNPTEFHKFENHCINSVIPNLLYSTSFTPERVWLECCCWYKLNTRLKFLKLENCNNMLYTFIRRPHECDPGKCVCCCKRKYDNFKKYVAPMPVHQTARNHFQNRWNQHLVRQSGQQTQNSLINAALLHKPNKKTINKKEKNKEYYRDTCLKLQLISSRSQTHGYYLGLDGLINTCYRSNIIPYTLQYFNDIIGGEHSVANVDICCLTKYNQYCQNLSKKAHATVVKFLVNSKINVTNKCINCQSLEIQNVSAKGVVVPLYLPKYPRHTRLYSKITRARDIIGNKINVQINAIENTQKSDPINEGMSNTNTIENLQTEPNINSVITSNNSEQIALNSIDLGINGLKLIISPGGKVKLKSKTRAEDISTENLKILREIIYHAHNKVLSLGFNPSRPINVKSLFVNKTQVKPPTKKPQKKRLAIKEVSSNIQSVKVKEIYNRNNNSAHPVTLEKTPVQSELNHNKNIYQALTKISAEKRQQYLISHEFLRNAGKNVWESVNMITNEKEKGNDIVQENTKRKTSDKATSPPPKQRKANSNTIPGPEFRTNILYGIGPVPSTSSSYTPTIPIAHLPSIVPIETLQQPQTENVPMTLPENVIPIGQLPQNIAINLYNKFAFLPVDTPQPLNIPMQSLNPSNITQQSMITSALPSLPLMQPPASVQTSSDIISVPAFENSEPIENDEADDGDDDCILGV